MFQKIIQIETAPCTYPFCLPPDLKYKSAKVEYIKVVSIIRDIYGIDQYAKSKGNKFLMEARGITRKTAGRTHPLSGVMDDIITT